MRTAGWLLTDEDGRIVERVTYDPDGTPHFWGEDTIRPRVTQLAWTGEGESPTGVTVDATTLVVRFSEAIHDATMAGLTLTLTPDPGSRTQALDGDGRTLKVTFEQPIPATTPTTLHLAGLRDRTGNTIFPFDTTFTLTDSQAYAVLVDSAAPTLQAVIDTQSGLVLTFDEPVQPPSGTPLHGAVTITRSGLSVDGTTTRLTETALAWTPSDPASWQPGGEYRLTALTLQDLHSQPNPIQTASLPLTITHLATQPTDALLAFTAPTDSAPLAASAYGQTALFQGREWHADLGMYYYRARWATPGIGFNQRDPIGYWDSPSRYQWLGLSTYSLTDPLGRWNEAFHWYVIYYLATLATTDSESVERIAWASQRVDEYDRSQPMSPNPWNLLFHFPDVSGEGTALGRENALAVSLAEQASAGESAVALGVALHTLADSYSHAGYTWRWGARANESGRIPYKFFSPALGHGKAGHDPDNLALNWDRAADAALACYDAIHRFAVRQGNSREQVNRDYLHVWFVLFFSGLSRDSEQWPNALTAAFASGGVDVPPYSSWRFHARNRAFDEEFSQAVQRQGDALWKAARPAYEKLVLEPLFERVRRQGAFK